jgi:hypothetical protein
LGPGLKYTLSKVDPIFDRFCVTVHLAGVTLEVFVEGASAAIADNDAGFRRPRAIAGAEGEESHVLFGGRRGEEDEGQEDEVEVFLSGALCPILKLCGAAVPLLARRGPLASRSKLLSIKDR